MLSKNVNNKQCAPKLIFFNEKKIEKDSDNFWYRKLTLKVKRLGDFALFDTSPLTQFSKFNNFLWVCWFLGKNLSNFVPPFENSTTHIAILFNFRDHCLCSCNDSWNHIIALCDQHFDMEGIWFCPIKIGLVVLVLWNGSWFV